MRLVILTEIISPYRIPVFNALARVDDIDLHVIFLSETDRSQRDWRVYKDEIRFSYEVLPSWRRRLGKYNVMLNRGVIRALRKAAPDAIICGGYSYVSSWQAMRWARRSGVRFLVWVESTLADVRGGHRLVEMLKKRFLLAASGFVVPGRSSFEYLKAYGISPEMIHTAPNAVDVNLFSNQSEVARSDSALRVALDLPPRFFLFVGRLVPSKGVFELLEAYAQLANGQRSVPGLIFVGDGPARQELERRATATAPGSVLFRGFVHREELGAYYALSDMLVFPTHSDPWGLVVNEAMSCGLPVIATSSAGCTADLVEDGWNGRVVTAGHVAELMSAMNDLANDSEMCQTMGERSRDRIRGYTPELCAAGLARAVAGELR